ncbi:MAG: GAF domain-containing protein [Anaerolineales bacterium]
MERKHPQAVRDTLNRIGLGLIWVLGGVLGVGGLFFFFVYRECLSLTWLWVHLVTGGAAGGAAYLLRLRWRRKTTSLLQKTRQLEEEIAHRQAAERALCDSVALYHATVDAVDDIIYVVDADLRFTLVNAAFQDLQHELGWGERAIIGRPLQEVFPDLAASERDAYHQVLDEGATILTEGRIHFGDKVMNGEMHKIPIEEEGEVYQIVSVVRDLTDYHQVVATLQQRNHELALLNRAGRALSATLELDRVLEIVLEEMRKLLDLTASSIWLVESEGDISLLAQKRLFPKRQAPLDEGKRSRRWLVCQHATGAQSDLVRGWRLPMGVGIVGRTAQEEEGMIVHDVTQDERHFPTIDEITGLDLHSILSVPLRGKNGTLGVIQMLDAEVGRFTASDLTLAESLATTAGMAIEKARLYRQVKAEAETKTTLLREVNHRVKNNLTSIIGLLYAERRRARIQDREMYQSIMTELSQRVQSLTMVHSMLSNSEWAPLRLDKLVEQVLHAALQVQVRDRRLSVIITPSAVRVTPDQAHHLALVINELATNTLKYAASTEGKISIQVEIYQKAERIYCVFKDQGPGYSSEVLEEGQYNVGLDLIHNIVRSELRGNLILENDAGAMAKISFRSEV